MTTNSELARKIFEDDYIDMEKMIYMLVNGYLRKFGGHLETVLTEAMFHFMLAVDSYNGHGALTTHVYHRVRGGLLEMRRRERNVWQRKKHKKGEPDRYVRLIPMSTMMPHEYERLSPSFHFLVDLLDQLSDDGQFLVRLLLSDEPELHSRIADRREQPRSIRRAVKSYMQEAHDWSWARINQTWNEVQGALT